MLHTLVLVAPQDSPFQVLLVLTLHLLVISDATPFPLYPEKNNNISFMMTGNLSV